MMDAAAPAANDNTGTLAASRLNAHFAISRCSFQKLGGDNSVSLTPRPVTADANDLDRENYLVIRASDGRPLAYIEKGIWAQDQEYLAKLFILAPDMLKILAKIFGASHPDDKPVLSRNEWLEARNEIRTIMVELGEL